MKAVTLAPAISVISIAGNPSLADATGIAQPLVAANVSTTEVVTDATITFAISGILEDSYTIGTMHSSALVLWQPTPRPALLKIDRDTQTNITVRLRAKDPQGGELTRTWYLPFTLRNISTLDEYGSPVLFVTRTSTVARSPQGIWDELRRNMTFTQFTGAFQLPSITAQKREGSEQDFALLMASAYDTAGLRTALVHGSAGLFPDPQKILVRVQYNSNMVTLDPALIDKPFDDALAQTPGAKVYDIAMVRKQRNFTVIS
jgi:hypothetical protein